MCVFVSLILDKDFVALEAANTEALEAEAEAPHPPPSPPPQAFADALSQQPQVGTIFF